MLRPIWNNSTLLKKIFNILLINTTQIEKWKKGRGLIRVVITGKHGGCVVTW